MRLELTPLNLSRAALDAFFTALTSACDGDATAVATDAEALEEASHDWSFHEPQTPCAVVSPSTVEQVAAVVKTCAAARVPMIPRGAGTGVEGGAIPYGGGVVISTERLRRLELLDQEMPPMVVVGAGIYKNELNSFLAPHGLLFGPDPSSNPSLGGMAATGGSGMSTLRYGTVKENVVSLVVVTPQGEIVRTRRMVRKSSSGYELTQLYLGSEGTLGIICELVVKLQRVQPYRSGGFLTFPDVKSAVDTVVATLRVDPPSLLRCELLNADGIRCTNTIFKTDLPGRPTLFLEHRGKSEQTLRQDFDTVASLAVKNGCTPDCVNFAAAGEELDTLWEARRGCYLAAMKYRGNKGGDHVFVSDVCVPVSRLAECVADTEADILQSGFECVICAHIADGNFHCLVPHQPHEREVLRELEERIISRALAFGGTVTGEHGVGVGKIEHSFREHGPEHVAVQQAVKRALDPLGLMNPGKVLPLADAADVAAEKSESGIPDVVQASGSQSDPSLQSKL